MKKKVSVSCVKFKFLEAVTPSNKRHRNNCKNVFE